MALETVTIRVVTDDLSNDPVDYVTVRAFDATGTTLETFGTTGSSASGEVEFTLLGYDPPVDYQLRFYRQGVGFISPQLISVYSPPSLSPTGTNNFEVLATMSTLPKAMDINLCRVSGVVRRPDGSPKPGTDFHFIPRFRPASIGGDLVVGERIAVRSDENGYLEFDLYRRGIYDLTMEGHDHKLLFIVVPDRDSIGLNDLVLPIVSSVTWDPPGPWALNVGDTLEVVPAVTASNYQLLSSMGLSDVVYSSEDSAIVSVSVGPSSLVLSGVGVGTTSIKATPIVGETSHIPEPSVSGDAVGVTVS
jgi:hypothetical protein